MIAESRVKYNRHERQWETWDASRDYEEAVIIGGLLVFPAGKEGKRAAMLSALTHDAPEVAAMVERLLKLSGSGLREDESDAVAVAICHLHCCQGAGRLIQRNRQ